MLDNRVEGAEEAVAGDMPRDSQFGYLFSGFDAHTVAHEVGHGIFNLQHIFNYDFSEDSKKGVLNNNLMNYPGGAHLIKFQWDAVHAPGIVWGLFERDEDAMKIVAKFSSEANRKLFEKINKELIKMPFYNEVYQYIEKETNVTYAFTEDMASIAPKSYTNRLGAATPLRFGDLDMVFRNFNMEVINFAFVDDEKKEVISMDDMFQLKTKPWFHGFILLKMDKEESNLKGTIFHELNHAAQFILYSNNRYPFNEATLEVETRMIMFYSAFKNASEDIRKDGNKMKEHFKKFYGMTSVRSDFAVFLGDALLMHQHLGKEYSYDEVYNICYKYFSSRVKNEKPNDADQEQFDTLMLELSRTLRKDFGYSFGYNSFKPNYYLLDMLNPLN